MKIRLVSIDGELGNFKYNLEQVKNQINKAVEDKIELLIIPDNSIISESLKSLKLNEDFNNIALECEKEIDNYINKIHEQNNLKIIYHCQEPTIVFKNYYFKIDNYARIESLESLNNAIENNQSIYKIDFKIVCKGNSNESISQGIYSNLKMIYFKDKLVCSNLENFENQIDYDFNELTEYSRTPYLDKIKNINQMFNNILYLQGVGLYHKLKSMNRKKICLGISGGLDSTVSLLVCVEIFKKYNIPLSNIIGVTMPGLGTTNKTYNFAMDLMKNLGITIEEIDLRELLNLHLKNIKQPKDKFDVTFEQCQSRERTQVLLDIANRDNAIMIGTGCMSEFALGWMTYGGDHLSMYAINIGLPKTIVKMYASWFKNYLNDEKLSKIIDEILKNPVSPELLPIDEKGQQHEKTESLIGDYLVQDFFIYHTTVNQLSIKKLYQIACVNFPEYNKSQIFEWLKIFVIRYYTRAYKKNCYGDGLKLFEYSVSPNYYRVPSDINIDILFKELEEIKNENI